MTSKATMLVLVAMVSFFLGVITAGLVVGKMVPRSDVNSKDDHTYWNALTKREEPILPCIEHVEQLQDVTATFIAKDGKIHATMTNGEECIKI